MTMAQLAHPQTQALELSDGPPPVDRLIAAALCSLAPHTQRVYRSRIRAWLAWSNGLPDFRSLDREHVKRYIRSLDLRGATAQVQNQALAALKKVASEGSELGWIGADDAVKVQKIKAKKITGVRTGRWLDAAQTQALLDAPDRTTAQGKRDAAVLALLVGCGLRRAEACGLTAAQVQVKPSGKLLLVNLTGKGGRVRTVAVPRWAAQPIREWIAELKKEETK